MESGSWQGPGPGDAVAPSNMDGEGARLVFKLASSLRLLHLLPGAVLG